jgi:GNAT superfamily N-acetyltransferase
MNYIITDVFTLYEKFYKMPENSDLFDGRLPLIDACLKGDDKLFLCCLNNKIIGFCLLNKKDSHTYVNEATSVDKNYRNQGIAKKLLQIAHQYAINKNSKIISSGYSIDGAKYLKKIDENFSTKYHITT